ncbi:hypothetical protein [Kitasatospora sp. NPDC054795]
MSVIQSRLTAALFRSSAAPGATANSAVPSSSALVPLRSSAAPKGNRHRGIRIRAGLRADVAILGCPEGYRHKNNGTELDITTELRSTATQKGNHHLP